MTELNTHSANSYGYVNPVGERPAFVTPVFSTTHSNALFVQEIDRRGRVIGFSELDEDEHQIVKLDEESIAVQTGDDAICAYETGSGEILIGTKADLHDSLKDEFQKLKGRNFLKLQIIQFIEPSDDSDAVRSAFLHLSKHSPVGAAVWRDIEIILPDIRDFIWDLSEAKPHIVELLPLVEEIRISSKRPESLEIGIPEQLYKALAGEDISNLGRKVLARAKPFKIGGVSFHLIGADGKSPFLDELVAKQKLEPSIAFIGIGPDGSSAVSYLVRYSRYAPSAPWRETHWDRIFGIPVRESSLANVFAATFTYDRLFAHLRQSKLNFSSTPQVSLENQLVVLVFEPDVVASEMIDKLVGQIKEAGIRVVGLMLREPYDHKSYEWLSRQRKSIRLFDGVILSHMWHSPSDRGTFRRRDYSLARKVVSQIARLFKTLQDSEEGLARILKMIRPRNSVSLAAFAPLSGDLSFALTEVVDKAKSSEFDLEQSKNVILFVETSKLDSAVLPQARSLQHMIPELRKPVVISSTKRGLGDRMDVTAVFCQTPIQLPNDLDFKQYCYRGFRLTGWKTEPPVGFDNADFVATKSNVPVPVYCIGPEAKSPSSIRAMGRVKNPELFPSIILCTEATYSEVQKKFRNNYGVILVVDRSLDFDQILRVATSSALELLSKMKPTNIVSIIEPYVRRVIQSENFPPYLRVEAMDKRHRVALDIERHSQGERVRLVGVHPSLSGPIKVELSRSGLSVVPGGLNVR